MNKKIKISLIIITYVCSILIATKVYASTGKMINNNTRIRKEASTSSDIVDILEIGTKVEILSEEGEWYKVKYNNKTGYIRKDMIDLEEEKTETSNETTSENTANENTTSENTTSENKANETTTSENTTNENTTSENATTSETETNQASEENSSNKEETQTENTMQVGYKGKLASSLNIKILPSINSSVIGTIEQDTEFSIKDVINKWCYIETENASGWVILSKINQQQPENNSQTEENKAEEKQEEEAKTENNETKNEEVKEEKTTKPTTKYVSAETLNLREKPNNEAEVIVGLRINTAVTVVEVTDNTWSKVTASGKTGYVASKYLSDTKVDTSSRNDNTNRASDTAKQTESEKKSTTDTNVADTTSKSESSSTASSGKGEEIVSYAKQFLGNPYVYGGTSLTNGCDCSGFVMSVYSHFGYSLPHSSSSLRSVGTAVDKSNLQPGDILCFSGHVGIYMGSNTFIHAANEKLGIITTSLSSSYYVKNYICARRVL